MNVIYKYNFIFYHLYIFLSRTNQNGSCEEKIIFFLAKRTKILYTKKMGRGRRFVKAIKNVVCLVTALILLLGMFVGCGKKAGDSFGFTLPREPQQIDPQVANDAASLAVIDATFEGLVQLDENGTPTPAAADWTVSDDGKTYTFTLKETCWNTVTVKGEQTGFEDPVIVNAQDFVFGIQRTASQETASPHAAQLRGIVNADKVLAGKKSPTALGVEAPNESTLIIRLEKADDTFLERVATPAFFPCNREFFNYTRGRYGLEKKYILTNGPFYVSAWEHGVSVSLQKNENYHGEAEIAPAAVKYRVSTTAQEDFDLLKSGTLDAAFVSKEWLEDAQKADISTVPLEDTVLYLWFNHTNAILKNTDIRTALTCAVEWGTVWSNLPDGCRPSNEFVPAASAVKGTMEDVEYTYATDKALATKSLARGAKQLGLKSLPTFTLLASEDVESADLARYLIQSFSKNLSIQCTLELVSEETLEARVKAGNYEMALYAATGAGLTAKENLACFTSSAAGNYARFSDKTYDALYKKADESAAAADRLQAYLLKMRPAIPLGQYTRYYGVREGVSGLIVRPFNGGKQGAVLDFRAAKIED